MEQARDRAGLEFLLDRAAAGKPVAGQSFLQALAEGAHPGALALLQSSGSTAMWSHLLEFLARGTWANHRLRIGPAGLAPRLKALVDGLFRLSDRGPTDQAKNAALEEGLRDPHPETRLVAARLLAFREPTPATVDRLCPLLKDPSAKVRGQAAAALSRTGLPETVPLLIEALGDPHGLVARDARRALTSLGDAAAAGLVASMKDERPRLRRMAARALGELAHTYNSAIPHLVEALRDPVNGVRWAAADALISGGEQAIPHLLRTTQWSDFDERLKDYVLYVLENQPSRQLRQRLQPLILALRDLDYRVESPVQARHLLDSMEGARQAMTAPLRIPTSVEGDRAPAG